MNEADPSPGDVTIRDVEDGDLPRFFEHQQDPEALRMAVVEAKDRADFMAHWAKIRADPAAIAQAVVVDGRVVGNVVSWEQSGMQFVGYWIGRSDWGRGIATNALTLLLDHVTARPLHAFVEVNNSGSIRVLEKCGFRQVPGPPSVSAVDGAEEVLLVLETAYARR
jgi:RimJ/RimL family protein N-acetyltransferase